MKDKFKIKKISLFVIIFTLLHIALYSVSSFDEGKAFLASERPDKAIAFFDKAAILSGADIIGKIRELQKECSSRLQGA